MLGQYRGFFARKNLEFERNSSLFTIILNSYFLIFNLFLYLCSMKRQLIISNTAELIRLHAEDIVIQETYIVGGSKNKELQLIIT